jgi:hypothetical protein
LITRVENSSVYSVKSFRDNIKVAEMQQASKILAFKKMLCLLKKRIVLLTPTVNLFGAEIQVAEM